MSKTPTIQEIIDYWEVRESECGLAVDWSEAHERCWRCGYERHLQKCHIIPDSLGGSNTPDNLVLLCVECHKENPNVHDKKFMWEWLRKEAQPYYDTYWHIRAAKEFEKIYGRENKFDIAAIEIAKKYNTFPIDIGNMMNEIDKLLEIQSGFYKKALESATVHFGEGNLNTSTRVWCLREAEKLWEEIDARKEDTGKLTAQ